jgi:hypothetical protein
LDEGVFDRASSLAFSPSWDEAAEGRLPRCNGIQPGTVEVEQAVSKGERPAMPRMASLRRADVANLTLADIDLSRCEFESTLHLEALRLATLCPFDDTRALSRRWTRRMTIHEERRWRVSNPKWGDWKDAFVARGAEPTRVATGEMEPWRHSEAERLAKTYRALRKGREDEGNAPGAGDFYYGEMEMRRHGEAAPSERAVIWLYWLVSGYGLRASRALLALGLTVLLFATLFSVFEIREGASFTDDLVFSLKSTTSLLRAPADDLSTGGQVLEIGLRLLGPLFFALAVLSLRGRVKR